MDENNDKDYIETTEVPDDVPQKSTSREILEWVWSIAVALVIALVLRNYVVTFVRVDGSSMFPTLTDEDRLIVIRLGYTPKQGDIVILNPPSGRGPYIKRVIGMPGQTVTIENGYVYIDGEKQVEDYVSSPTYPKGLNDRFEVPEGYVMVLGDNREDSHDSRADDVGLIKFENVLGKAVVRVWPLNKLGPVNK